MAYGDVHCFDPDAPHDHVCPADHAFDRWLAAHDAEVRADGAGGPDWEWGTALRASNGAVWDEFWHASREEAVKEISEDAPDDHMDDEIILVRRTRAVPAGAIEVVPGTQGEESKEEDDD